MGKASANVSFLKKFQKAKKSQRVKYLKNASKDEIISLCECVGNIVRGNLPLTNKQVGALRKHQKYLSKIAFNKHSLKTKRNQLIQHGGFLPQVASIALPFLLNLLTS